MLLSYHCIELFTSGRRCLGAGGAGDRPELLLANFLAKPAASLRLLWISYTAAGQHGLLSLSPVKQKEKSAGKLLASPSALSGFFTVTAMTTSADFILFFILGGVEECISLGSDGVVT